MELATLSEQVEQSEREKARAAVLSDNNHMGRRFLRVGEYHANEIVMENIKMEKQVIVMKGIVNSQDGQQ